MRPGSRAVFGGVVLLGLAGILGCAESTAVSDSENAGGSNEDKPAASAPDQRPPANRGAATLTWLPPTQKTDGSPLIDLAGYRVYWGRNSETFRYMETIPNAGVTTYIVEGLRPGTWRFAVTAFDARGTESGFSNTALKVIPE